MKAWAIFVMLVMAGPGHCETVVAAHTIRAQAVITALDLAIKKGDVPGAATSVDQLIGQEARVTLYAGRPVRPADVGPPAVIERNQLVPLIYNQHGLRITAEGRSMSRAGAGEYIKVMNMSSRATVMGRVAPDGRVFVSQ